MTRWLPAVAGMMAVIAAGAVHGVMTGRWGLSDEPAASAARLAQVPLTLDDWDGEVQPMTSHSGMAGLLCHRYAHKQSGKTVTVFIVCDRPGPVSIHTPDVCYGSAGYQVSDLARFTAPAEADAAPAEFWTAQFGKKTPTETSYLRIFWAWGAAGAWQAADNPRNAFAGRHALYKIYLIREMTTANDPLPDDPCIELMRQLLPALRRALFE